MKLIQITFLALASVLLAGCPLDADSDAPSGPGSGGVATGQYQGFAPVAPNSIQASSVAIEDGVTTIITADGHISVMAFEVLDFGWNEFVGEVSASDVFYFDIDVDPNLENYSDNVFYEIDYCYNAEDEVGFIYVGYAYIEGTVDSYYNSGLDQLGYSIEGVVCIDEDIEGVIQEKSLALFVEDAQFEWGMYPIFQEAINLPGGGLPEPPLPADNLLGDYYGSVVSGEFFDIIIEEDAVYIDFEYDGAECVGDTGTAEQSGAYEYRVSGEAICYFESGEESIYYEGSIAIYEFFEEFSDVWLGSIQLPDEGVSFYGTATYFAED
jgi:hypothetical protein